MNYTNAATIVDEEFKDAEDLDGVFSGLMEYKGGVPEWPFNGFVGQYDDATWQYAGARSGSAARGGADRRPARRRSSGPRSHEAATPAAAPAAAAKAPQGPPFEPLVASLLQPRPTRDETLQNPRCVFQIVKRHFSRYTPEMVEQVTGCPQRHLSSRSPRPSWPTRARTGPPRSPMRSPGRSTPTASQIIGCCALLQLLLGNIGRPGAGIMALRGHASIQGSTDIPTLYHSIHGYMAAPRR